MSVPSSLVYWIIGGVVAMSFLSWLIVGFDNAWFVPLIVIPFALFYALIDRRVRREEERPGSNIGH